MIFFLFKTVLFTFVVLCFCFGCWTEGVEFSFFPPAPTPASLDSNLTLHCRKRKPQLNFFTTFHDVIFASSRPPFLRNAVHQHPLKNKTLNIIRLQLLAILLTLKPFPTNKMRNTTKETTLSSLRSQTRFDKMSIGLYLHQPSCFSPPRLASKVFTLHEPAGLAAVPRGLAMPSLKRSERWPS